MQLFSFLNSLCNSDSKRFANNNSFFTVKTLQIGLRLIFIQRLDLGCQAQLSTPICGSSEYSHNNNPSYQRYFTLNECIPTSLPSIDITYANKNSLQFNQWAR